MPMEIEIKLAVDVQDLWRLREALAKPEAEKDLKNLYFDSRDKKLRLQRIMVRMRTRSSVTGAVLCVKGPSENRDGVFRAEEHEWNLSTAEASEFEAKPGSQALRLDPLIPSGVIHQLEAFGSIRVQRSVYEIASGLYLELDHVRYSDGSEDAEMEMEAPENRLEEARKLLDDLLEKAGVRARAQEKTKYQRFLERV